MSIGAIDYHLRRLEEIGVVHVAEEKPAAGRRGPPQHYYDVQKLVVSPSEWRRLPPVIREALTNAVLRELEA